MQHFCIDLRANQIQRLQRAFSRFPVRSCGRGLSVCAASSTLYASFQLVTVTPPPQLTQFYAFPFVLAALLPVPFQRAACQNVPIVYDTVTRYYYA